MSAVGVFICSQRKGDMAAGIDGRKVQIQTRPSLALSTDFIVGFPVRNQRRRSMSLGTNPTASALKVPPEKRQRVIYDSASLGHCFSRPIELQ